MVGATACAAACVLNDGRPGVKPCAIDLPLGVRLPFIPFDLPLLLPLPLETDEDLPFPFALGRGVALSTTSLLLTFSSSFFY